VPYLRLSWPLLAGRSLRGGVGVRSPMFHSRSCGGIRGRWRACRRGTRAVESACSACVGDGCKLTLKNGTRIRNLEIYRKRISADRAIELGSLPDVFLQPILDEIFICIIKLESHSCLNFVNGKNYILLTFFFIFSHVYESGRRDYI
jgi:hypothetical protein